MATKTLTAKGQFILYDDALLSHADADLFSAEHWTKRAALRATAGGRGQSWVLKVDGDAWVLRHYRRGGLVGRCITDHYLWTGLKHSRPWREWHLLAELSRDGLPVPRPVAARLTRQGLSYQGDLITRLIPDTRSLASRLTDTRVELLPWRQMGVCIRRFHDAGIFHADLNAHNLLIAGGDDVYMVDFDRCARRAPGARWQKGNLRRLLRSLHKLKVPQQAMDPAWRALLDGYHSLSRPLTRAGRS